MNYGYMAMSSLRPIALQAFSIQDCLFPAVKWSLADMLRSCVPIGYPRHVSPRQATVPVSWGRLTPSDQTTAVVVVVVVVTDERVHRLR